MDVVAALLDGDGLKIQRRKYFSHLVDGKIFDLKKIAKGKLF